jgi:DNA-binding Lrp family transcriptional regulator
MAATKVPAADLRAYLDAGHSQADAARQFGVSEPAIHQRLKRMKRLTSQVVALEQAGAVVEEQLTATERLQHAERVIFDQLEWAETQARQPGVDRTQLIDTLIKVTTEIRQQVTVRANLTRMLYDMKVIREFQETVVETIREESPETARRIIARLKDKRALRPSADLPSLAGGPSNGGLA